jgi:hypothetical protein
MFTTNRLAASRDKPAVEFGDIVGPLAAQIVNLVMVLERNINN